MLLVGHGLVITRDDQLPLIRDGCVAIAGETILAVGQTADLRARYPQARLIDAHGQLVMPGLINTHMHFYSTFARGMALKDPPPANFREILERLWWRLDRTLTLEDVYYSALVPLIDCIRQGTTTVFDHHASANALPGSLLQIAAACRATGMRACLSYEVSDRDGPVAAAAGIRENQDFIAHCRAADDPMLQAMFGLHASFTLSDQTLASCAAANQGSRCGFHIHVAEGIEDVEMTRARYGQGVVKRLETAGILGRKTLAVHCVHVTPEEMDILQATQTNVVHNPESNLGNAVGYPPVLDMLAKGILIGLGTDGYTCDLFESLKIANCLIKHETRQPSAGWIEPPAMLFTANPAIAALYFPQPLGRLVPGAGADLIIVNYDPPTRLDPGNINSHLLFGVSGLAVDTTIINGQVVMENRVLTTIDEAAVRARSRELAAQVWTRF